MNKKRFRLIAVNDEWETVSEMIAYAFFKETAIEHFMKFLATHDIAYHSITTLEY